MWVCVCVCVCVCVFECVRRAERETYSAPQSDCLPQPGSSTGVREAAESQGSHFYQVKRLEAPLACLVKG